MIYHITEESTKVLHFITNIFYVMLFVMPNKKLSSNNADRIIERFSRIQELRHRSLEILLNINRKVSDYKIKKLKEKLKGTK